MGGIPTPGAAKAVADATFEQMVENEDGWSDWIHPLPGYRMKCCGCGLVHSMQFAIVQNTTAEARLNDGEDDKAVIVFRAQRERAPRERAVDPGGCAPPVYVGDKPCS